MARILLGGMSLFCAGLAIWWVGSLAGRVDPGKLVFARTVLSALAVFCGLCTVFFGRVVGLVDGITAFFESRSPGTLPRRAGPGRLENALMVVYLGIVWGIPALLFLDLSFALDLIEEDAILENISVGFYLVALGMTLALIARAKGRTLLRVHLGVLALLFLFVAGEEISWGQRIFGIETPEAIGALNVQNEMNFHNMWSTSVAQYAGLLVCAALLCFLPLLHRFHARSRRLLDAISFPVAPARIAMLWALGFGVFLLIGMHLGTTGVGPFSKWGREPDTDDEFFEFYLSFLFFMTTVVNWRIDIARLRGAVPPAPPAESPEEDPQPEPVAAG